MMPPLRPHLSLPNRAGLRNTVRYSCRSASIGSIAAARRAG